MLDLTKEIQLNPEFQKKYTLWRILLYFVFVLVTLFVGYRILFPIVPLDFDMNSPNANKNTLVSPHLEQTKQFPSKGIIGVDEKFVFNANPIGQFSNATIQFDLGKNPSAIDGSTVEIQKSFIAFFYPTGNPVGFPDGNLLTTKDGDYYIVSDGKLRKFADTKTILELGYPKSAFVSVSPTDLAYNEKGDEITDQENHPNNTIFAIEDTYYELKDGQLFPFVSSRALSSRLDPICAIAKSVDFFAKYPSSETYLGFANGTLASSADSVYILSDGKSFPVETADTFNAMGFDWNSVIPITQDELGVYEKQKQFTHDQPHPNGVTFFDQKTNESFMIENGLKRMIPSEAIVQAYSKQKPVLTDSETLLKKTSCQLEKNFWGKNIFQCSVKLDEFSNLIGNSFRISLTFPVKTNLKSIRATFSTPLSTQSLKNSLSKIKERIYNR